MSFLPTNFKDDVMATSMGGKRRYQMIANSDGTYSFTDATEYTQEGDSFGAAEVNSISTNVNASLQAQDTYTGNLDNLQTGVWSIKLASCTNVPESSGNAIISCVSKLAQTLYIYTGSGTSITVSKIYQRVGNGSALGAWSQTFGGYELIQDGLTVRESRCTISSGGYYKVGNMCYFQLALKLKTSLAGPNYWVLVDGMPRPISKVAVSVATDAAGGAARTATIDLADDGTNGTVVIRNSASIASGDVLNFSGFYLMA